MDIVLGSGRDGSEVTVVDAFSLGFGNAITASSVLIGGHFRSKEAIQFASANLNLTHLEVWSEHSPTGGLFPAISAGEEDVGSPFQIKLPYRKKKLFDFEMPSRACRIEIYSGVDTSWQAYKSLMLTHGVLVYIEPSEPQGIMWYQRFFRDCTALFSFLVGAQVCRTSSICSPARSNDGSEAVREIEVLDQSRSFALTPIDHPHGMPLPLSALQNLAPVAFDKWFSSASDLGSVYRLLIETLPPNDLTLDTTFLRLAQATEVFYRRIIKGTYVEPDKFDSYLDAIVSNFPADMPANLRSRMNSYLKYGNEYSLKSVVKLLLDDLDASARNYLRIENPTEFARTVANTRNSLTHLTVPDSPVASTALQYYEMNKRLRALLYGVLAKWLGFDVAALQQCFARVMAYL